MLPLTTDTATQLPGGVVGMLQRLPINFVKPISPFTACRLAF